MRAHMRRWLDGCERLLTLVAAVATFGMMILTTVDAGGRYLFNRPILAAYELTTNYLMIAAVAATFQQARLVWATTTTFVTLELPLWPAHLLVCIGLFLTTVLMLVDLKEVRKGRSSLLMNN